MPQLTVANRQGEVVQIDAQQGLSVMEIIRNAGVDEMLALCGGCNSCATCHVYVEERFSAHLPALTDDERELLDGSEHRRSDSRLSCQLVMSDALNGMRVTIAPED